MIRTETFSVSLISATLTCLVSPMPGFDGFGNAAKWGRPGGGPE